MLKKDGKAILEEFLTNGPFSSDWSAEDALKYIADIKAKLAMLREHEASLRGDLGIFGLSLPDTVELTKLERVHWILYQSTLFHLYYIRRKLPP